MPKNEVSENFKRELSLDLHANLDWDFDWELDRDRYAVLRSDALGEIYSSLRNNLCMNISWNLDAELQIHAKE